MSRFWTVILLTGFIGGVTLRSFVNFGWALALFFVCLGIVILVISLIADSRKQMASIAIFIIAFGLGITRYELKDSRDNTKFLEQKVGQKVTLEGIIVEEPDERENYVRLIINTNGNKILLYANHYPEFHYGDKIKAIGLLKKPQEVQPRIEVAPRTFDWVSYLAKDEIYFEINYPQIEFISPGNGSLIKEKMFALKNSFIKAISKVVPEPNSAFMAGLTVGARKSIPKDLQDDFRKTGIIHIVVLSGYNITIVSDTIMRFFSFLPRMFGVTLGVLGIILFSIMTGASATVVRASLMALLVILARATGRFYEISWALFVTGFLMVFQNPKILRFDSSFQLSFLATLSLIYLAPYFEKRLHFVSKKFNLRGIVSVTLATQIFVLPLLLYKMGLFPTVSLPVNLLILTFVPATMFFGFITGGIGMFSSILSIPFGWLSYLLTQYELWIVKIFAGLPFASKIISNFPTWLMLVIYAIYAIIIYKINARH